MYCDKKTNLLLGLYFIYLLSRILVRLPLFQNLLHQFSGITYLGFPLKKTHYNHNNKAWITPGIKISSQHKRNLYLICRNTKDPKLKSHYKTYCRILSEVTKTAKKLHYNKLIINSNNNVKTTCDIVKMETPQKK
jgi:hypothetical protein